MRYFINANFASELAGALFLSGVQNGVAHCYTSIYIILLQIWMIRIILIAHYFPELRYCRAGLIIEVVLGWCFTECTYMCQCTAPCTYICTRTASSCMYVHMYTYSLFLYVRTYVHIQPLLVCTYICTRTASSCKYVHIYTYSLFLYARTYVHVQLLLVSMYICTRTASSTYICTRIASSTYICIRTASCMYICTRTILSCKDMHLYVYSLLLCSVRTYVHTHMQDNERYKILDGRQQFRQNALMKHTTLLLTNTGGTLMEDPLIPVLAEQSFKLVCLLCVY